jgi:ABC-type sugar transport system substrate-binding protein
MRKPDDVIELELGAGVSRRKLLSQLSAAVSAGALTGLAGCGGQPGQETGTPTEMDSNEATDTTQQSQDDGDDGDGDGNGDGGGSAPNFQLVNLTPPPTELDYTSAPPERSITMVTHDASTSFFVPTIAGLHDAARQLGWSATFTGPTSGFDVTRQVELIESAIDSGPDAIATTIVDQNAYNNTIPRAFENGIPVVSYNTNPLTRDQMREKFGRALAYTGQGQVGAGYVCGLALLERLPDDASTVTIGTCCPGASFSENRSAGMEMAIRQNSDLELTEMVNYTGQASEGVSKLENHITANPDVDGIIGTDAFTWFIGDALANQGMEGDIVGGGFDLTSQTLEHISDGVLKFTIGQDPYSQGYVPTNQMFQYLDRGIPPKNYPTGAEVIDTSNVDFALRRSDWGTLREWQQS